MLYWLSGFRSKWQSEHTRRPIRNLSDESLMMEVFPRISSGENGDRTHIHHTMIRLRYRPAASVGYETLEVEVEMPLRRASSTLAVQITRRNYLLNRLVLINVL